MYFKEGDQVQLTGEEWKWDNDLFNKIVTINGFNDDNPVFDFDGEEYAIYVQKGLDYSATLVTPQEETTQEETNPFVEILLSIHNQVDKERPESTKKYIEGVLAAMGIVIAEPR